MEPARGTVIVPGSPGHLAEPIPAGGDVERGRRAQVIGGFATFLLIVIIGYLNLTKYFVTYAWGLPEHNQPWGLQIARFIDSQPADTPVKLAACCWGDWKQPEPEGIFYVLKHQQGRENIISGKYLRSCAEVAPGEKTAIIFPPSPNSDLPNMLRACFPDSAGELHFDALGQPVFYSLLIH